MEDQKKERIISDFEIIANDHVEKLKEYLNSYEIGLIQMHLGVSSFLMRSLGNKRGGSDCMGDKSI